MKLLHRGYIYEAVNDHLTDEFFNWFGESVVVDEDGAPLPCYRGEHGISSTDLHSRFRALSFTPDYSLAELYATEPNNTSELPVAPRVGRYFLKVEKPVIDTKTDPFIDFNLLSGILGVDYVKGIFGKLSEHLENTTPYQKMMKDYDSNRPWNFKFSMVPPERLKDLYVEAYLIFDIDDVVIRLQSLGYDGAIFESSGDGSHTYEIRVFDTANVRSAI